MFQRGMKVVCINADFPPEVWELCNDIPERNRIYTVREVCIAHHYKTGRRGRALKLEEINNELPWGGEPSFNIRRFHRASQAQLEAARLASAEALTLYEDGCLVLCGGTTHSGLARLTD